MAASLASSFSSCSNGKVVEVGDLNTHLTPSSNEIKMAKLNDPEAGRFSGSQAQGTPCRSALARRQRA